MTSISFSEQQHTPDITHMSTKLTKLITVLPILYYFHIFIILYYFHIFILLFLYYLNGYSLNAVCDTISNFLE